MQWLLLVFALVVGLFAFVIGFGAPYLPTLKQQIDPAFDLLALKPGQTLLELGCGDGKILIAAAKKGYSAVGYELNPLLAFVAWLRTRRYGNSVRVIWGNYWQKEWPEASGIFVFLLDKYMKKLDKKIVQYGKPVRLVSFAFKVPAKRVQAQNMGLYLYEYK